MRKLPVVHISSCVVGQITTIIRASRLHMRGASRSSRTLEAGCDGRDCPLDERRNSRTAKACGPDPPTLGSSRQMMIVGDGGYQAGTPAIECTHLLLPNSAKTDSLAGDVVAEGGLMAVGLGRFGDRRLEKGGRYCMRPSFVGLVRAFGGLPGTEHERFGSRVFCATRR
jgi:hypothetical protein